MPSRPRTPADVIGRLPEPGAEEYAQLTGETRDGSPVNGIGGGVSNGPQYRAVADAIDELSRRGPSAAASLSPGNPYVKNAVEWQKASANDMGGPSGLGRVALGRAANDAFAYEKARKAMGLPTGGADAYGPTQHAAGGGLAGVTPNAPDVSAGSAMMGRLDRRPIEQRANPYHPQPAY
jgi:hypothetical protein